MVLCQHIRKAPTRNSRQCHHLPHLGRSITSTMIVVVPLIWETRELDQGLVQHVQCLIQTREAIQCRGHNPVPRVTRCLRLIVNRFVVPLITHHRCHLPGLLTLGPIKHGITTHCAHRLRRRLVQILPNLVGVPRRSLPCQITWERATVISLSRL